MACVPFLKNVRLKARSHHHGYHIIIYEKSPRCIGHVADFEISHLSNLFATLVAQGECEAVRGTPDAMAQHQLLGIRIEIQKTRSA